MNDKIQLKRGTLENWLNADPILLDGEMALVATDASKPTVYDSKKVGDGIHKFSELEMLGYKCLQELGDSQQFPISQKAITDWINNGYQFKGIATPDTNPGTPDGPVFYIASEPGTYVNFNGLTIKEGETAILFQKNGWTKNVLFLEYLGLFTDNNTCNSLIKELYINGIEDNADIRIYRSGENIVLEIRYASTVKSQTKISSGGIVKLSGYADQNIDGYIIFDFDSAQSITSTPVDAKINSNRVKNIFLSPCIQAYLEYCSNAYIEESIIPALEPIVAQDIAFVHDDTIYTLEGKLVTFSLWCSTDILKISDFPIVEIDILLRDGANAVSFYDANSTYISGITNPAGVPTATKRITSIDIPDGAIYYSFSRSKIDSYVLKSQSQFNKLENTVNELSSHIEGIPVIKDTQQQIITDLYTLNSITTQNGPSRAELIMALSNRLYFNNDYYPGYTVTSIIIHVPDNSEGGDIMYGLCKKDGTSKVIGIANIKAGINNISTNFKIGLDEYVYIQLKSTFNVLTYGPCSNQVAYMWLLNTNKLEEYKNRSFSFDIKVEKLISNIESLPELENIEKNNSNDALYLISKQSKKVSGSISWLAIGDSFTEINDIQSANFTKGYMTRTIEKIPQLSYTNMGHSGQTFGSTANTSTYPLTRADLYTVLFGTNDWDQDVALGTISDFEARTYNGTILGNFGGLIAKLLQIDTDALKKLIVMTPTERGFYSRSLSISFDGSTNHKESYHSSETPNKIGVYLSDIAKGIVQCCKQEKIRCVDLNTKSYISAKNAVHGGYVYKNNSAEQVFVENPNYLQYLKDNETLSIKMYQQNCIYTTYDGLHPSDLGFEIIARLLSNEIRKIIF